MRKRTRSGERCGEDRRGFRLRTRRVGVGLKITVTAAEPVLVVYIVHVAFAAAVAAAGSYLRPLKLDDDIDDATTSLRHSLEAAVPHVEQHLGAARFFA